MRWARRAKTQPLLGRFAGDERGSVTAEFAIVLPVVVAVLGLVIASISLASHRISLVSLTAEAARLEARGDTAQARRVLERAVPGASVSRASKNGLHCVTMRARPAGGLLHGITISATSCAALSEAGVTQNVAVGLESRVPLRMRT